MEQIVVIAALVLGLTKAIKVAGLSSKYLPVVALIIGVLLSGALYGFNATVLINTGLVAALSAMGLYSGTRAIKG